MGEFFGHIVFRFVGHILFKLVAFWPGLIWHGSAAAVGVASWWLMLGGTVMLMAARRRRRLRKRLAVRAGLDDASGAARGAEEKERAIMAVDESLE
jgi:hypothetical protein